MSDTSDVRTGIIFMLPYSFLLCCTTSCFLNLIMYFRGNQGVTHSLTHLHTCLLTHSPFHSHNTHSHTHTHKSGYGALKYCRVI